MTDAKLAELRDGADRRVDLLDTTVSLAEQCCHPTVTIGTDQARALLADLASQSERIKALEGALRKLVDAGSEMLTGLDARIDAAPKTAVPVFIGIADLHHALHHARATLTEGADHGG